MHCFLLTNCNPTYRQLIGGIFRQRDEICRRNQLEDSGQSNTEEFDDLPAGIEFEIVAVELSIWDVRDDADRYMMIDTF
jgi:hypothetical protein